MKKNLILRLITIIVLIIILCNFMATNFVYGVNPEDYMNDLQDDNFQNAGNGEAENAIGGMDNDQFARTNKGHNF